MRNEKYQRENDVCVPLSVLEEAEYALGNFCSDLGWTDADMQAMDNISAYIARHKANQKAQPEQTAAQCDPAETGMANYTLTIVADSGYESITEGRCNAKQYGAAIGALHGIKE